LNLTPADASYETHRIQFLKDYEAAMTVDTCLFDGVPELLAQIKSEGMSWGIVTNKATYLATPIVKALGLAQDCAVLVCGDTTAHSKPHPLPLLHAAQQAGYGVERCLYVGDDLRDIQAAQAAGMASIAAAYGYCGPEHPPETWQADHCAYSAREMWPAIQQLMR
jgi:phosphoglycolate phosphatase